MESLIKVSARNSLLDAISACRVALSTLDELERAKMKAAVDSRVWHEPMSVEDYHADMTHDSSSSLAVFNESPSRYYHLRITKRIKPPAPSEVQRAGNACHAALLEPERLGELIAIVPDDVLSANAAKVGKAWEAWKAEHAGQIHLKRDAYDLLRWKIDAVWSNPQCAKLLSEATVREHSIFWIDDEERRLKARLDLAVEIDCLIGDVKNTTRDESQFWRNVRDYGLHRQAALYCDSFVAKYGVEPRFWYLIVHDDPPFESCVRTFPADAITLGRRQNAETLTKLYECKRGQRPWSREGYDEVRELTIPTFFYPADGPLAEIASDDY